MRRDTSPLSLFFFLFFFFFNEKKDEASGKVGPTSHRPGADPELLVHCHALAV